jgi:ribosomal protein S18 acetylase RimI-like enzyme
MSVLETRPVHDPAWIGAFLRQHWGADFIVSRGRKSRPEDMVGVQALMNGEVAGLVTWRIDGDEMEILSLDSLDPQSGVGTALLEHTIATARVKGMRRVWLATSNDNLDALRFYQRRGMRLCAIHRDSVAACRKLKPEIPEIGKYGIPLSDEVELERVLR